MLIKQKRKTLIGKSIILHSLYDESLSINKKSLYNYIISNLSFRYSIYHSKIKEKLIPNDNGRIKSIGVHEHIGANNEIKRRYHCDYYRSYNNISLENKNNNRKIVL